MGKGDKRTKRGKIFAKSFGKSRLTSQRKREAQAVVAAEKAAK